VVLVLGSLFVYARVFAGSVSERVLSPDRRLVVEVRTLKSLSALDANYVAVRLSRRFSPFRHVVFGGLDYGAKITVSWTESNDLIVKCVDCENLRDHTAQSRWNGVTIHYQFVSSRKVIDDTLRSLQESRAP
jgi:hypothetical protein